MVDKSKLPKVKYHPTDKYMNAVIESYENYREEERLTTDRGRRVEFLTTMRILREWIEQKKLCILDVAAGTGVYAFPLSKEGHEVTATDITPRHVQIMNQIIKEKGYPIKTAVMDACNLDGIPDESYDIVLNMGPFYHLTDFDAREKCLAECLRVLKKDGLLVTAYIPRFSVFAYVALQNPNYLNEVLSKQIISTGTLHSDDDYCFWTDTCYATVQEMNDLYHEHGLDIVDHFAQDGISPHFKGNMSAWSEEQYATWCEYHYSICREPSILGSSNHVVIIGKKK